MDSAARSKLILPHLTSSPGNSPAFEDGKPFYEANQDAMPSDNISEKAMKERQRIKNRLCGFDSSNSCCWTAMKKMFNHIPNHKELTNLAKIAGKIANITVDRDAKRRKIVLIHWFEEHWEKLFPILSYISSHKECLLNLSQMQSQIIDQSGPGLESNPFD